MGFVDKINMKWFKYILIGLFVLLFVCIFSIGYIYDYKDSNLNKELQRRIDFCSKYDTTYELYLYDCTIFGECNRVYLNCDLIKQWEQEKINHNGFKIDDLKDVYSQYQESIENNSILNKYGIKPMEVMP